MAFEHPNNIDNLYANPFQPKPEVIFHPKGKEIVNDIVVDNAIISRVQKNLKEDPERMVDISSYASKEGINDNEQLSQRGANHIKDELIRGGIDPNRIKSVKGFGPTSEFNDKTKTPDSEENLHLNRRTEISYTYKEGGIKN